MYFEVYEMENISIIVKPNYSTYVKYKKKYLRNINKMLSDLGTVETPEVPIPNGVGVTLWEVVAIYLVSNAAEPFLSEIATKIADKYVDLRTNIRNAFYENFQCYGYRRIYAVLRKGGKIISEKVVRRIMYPRCLSSSASAPQLPASTNWWVILIPRCKNVL
jgi:hypothetical protein